MKSVCLYNKLSLQNPAVQDSAAKFAGEKNPARHSARFRAIPRVPAGVESDPSPVLLN